MDIQRESLRRRSLPAALLLPVLLLACAEPRMPMASEGAIAPDVTTTATAGLFFSEYIEGTSNNKALEIYNGTGMAVDLGAGGYNVQMFFNGSPTALLTINLIGTVADGDVFVLAHSSAIATILAQADQTNGAGWFNGDDAVVLRIGTTVVDAIGQIGFDPGTEWGSGLVSTADNTLRRKAEVCGGDADGTNAFDPSVEWDGHATDTFDGLGAHTASCGEGAPAVLATVPVVDAIGVAVDTDITVTFNEPVDVSGDWFSIACTGSGSHTATVTGGPTSFALNPDTDFAPAEVCTVTVHAAGVTDQDADDPPDNLPADYAWSFITTGGTACLLPYTPIPAIQGSGLTTPLLGETHATQGVVVGDFEGGLPGLQGFYLQSPDAAADADPATSEGIFVFNGSNDNVAPGDLVRVRGTAQEFQGQTQIGAVTTIVICSTGATVTPAAVSLPVASATDLERFEGMLVHLPQTLHVTDNFQLGRFGEVVLSSSPRLYQPTSVVAPGAPAIARQIANDLDRIILDDGDNAQNADPIVFGGGGNPLTASNTLRAGDAATGITGVLGYSWAGAAASGNAYRVRPVNALGGVVPTFVALNPRPTGPDPVGGTLRVASFNLLNYFNTFGAVNCTNGVGGAPTLCRGADDASEFERQSAKTVAAISALNADILGVVELENDGYGPTSAIAELVSRLDAATAPGTWSFIDADAGTGMTNAAGVDAIKVGLLYRPASVTPIGAPAVLAAEAFVNGGDSEQRNRVALAQTFEDAGGGRLVVAVNHLKSRGSPCAVPDAGDGQGECNAVRTAAATVLRDWLATDPTGTGDADVLIIGDLNSYAMEDPVTILKIAGYVDLPGTFIGPDAYSFSFGGQWGYLDHALATASLASQVTGVTTWHINADEPSVLDYNTNFKSAGHQVSLYAPDAFRSGDHDALIIGVDLTPTLFYEFTGFLPPLLAEPAVNLARAGRVLPVRFGLGGDQGLDVFAAGYPQSQPIDCATGSAIGPASSTSPAGRSGLSYDPETDSYTYAWKAEKSWAGTCRALVMELADGTVHRALFEFR